MFLRIINNTLHQISDFKSKIYFFILFHLYWTLNFNMLFLIKYLNIKYYILIK